jgi:hypothetical protein
MGSRNFQTAAKRAREQALRERRERKQAKKAEVAAERAAAKHEPPGEIGDDPDSTPPASAQQSALT